MSEQTENQVSKDHIQKMSVKEIALRYIRLGLSVIPIRADGSKAAAASWAE